MPQRWLKSIITISVVVLCIEALHSPLYAQNNDSDDFEVYLDFRHRGVVNSVIITYYKADEFYLPVSELFSLFKIDHTVDGLTIAGNFGIQQIPYRINFQANQIRFGDRIIDITVDDYLIKELDFYLRADIFYEAFDLDFTINFNNLTLNLETRQELPAIAEALRKQRRKVADRNRYSEERYELRYDRERPFLDGGFVDYNLSSNINASQNVYNFNTNLGLQVYGGDLQGAVFGTYSDAYSNFSTNNLRWRYMYRNQPWLTKLTIGQTTTDGVTRSRYTGIRLSNEPIEPRRLFDEFEIQGSTIPESEIELYLNNALIDFQQADELGEYRFLTPISYGTSRLNLKIYGPTGQIIERNQRIQVPFTFQPEGVFSYNINAGRLDNPLIGSTEQKYTAQGSGAYGFTDWLTAKAGVEYYEGFHTGMPTFTGTLSSRILSNYIVTAEAVSEVYYRGVLNAVYPNSASINVDYTNFTDTGGMNVYNISNDDKRLTASIFYPFNFWGLPLNLRASTFSRIRETNNSTTTIRFDANARFGKLNLRLGYSDRYTGKIDLLNPGSTSNLESNLTYTISRNRNLPVYLRGVFVRAALRYQPALDQVESAELLVSRNLFLQGRFQLAAGRNFPGGFNTLRFSLVVDFNKVRTNSTYSNIRNTGNFTQNVRGSIGYDTNYRNMIFTSRDQVGRSGAAIQLFVDNDASGNYNDGDDPINANAVRVQRSGANSVMKNGVLYLTQMQPYYYYNMDMNKGAVPNPMLVPEFEQFGLITDPNRFKKVEIPFYMSGVIEGVVEREYADSARSRKGVAGLRLLLSQVNGDHFEEIRTFSDGSYYAYEMPPGEYKLVVDPGNLERLGTKSVPDTLKFEVKAVPEGDFVEGLNFLLVPIDKQVSKPEPVTTGVGVNKTENNGGGLSLEYNIAVDSLQQNACRYSLQLGAYSSLEAAQHMVKEAGEEPKSYVVYNQPRQLYAVRTGQFGEMSTASSAVAKLPGNFREAVIVNQCSAQTEPSLNAGAIRFDVQFAAFSNPARAVSFVQDTEAEYGLNLHTIQDQESGLYKVRLGPFRSEQEAKSRRAEIIRSAAFEELYITKTDLPATVINADFDFMLQLGEFETQRQATMHAVRVEEDFGIHSKILVDESGIVILVIDKTFTDWNEMLSLRTSIREKNSYQPPVIHLIEKRNN